MSDPVYSGMNQELVKAIERMKEISLSKYRLTDILLK